MATSPVGLTFRICLECSYFPHLHNQPSGRQPLCPAWICTLALSLLPSLPCVPTFLLTIPNQSYPLTRSVPISSHSEHFQSRRLPCCPRMNKSQTPYSDLPRPHMELLIQLLAFSLSFPPYRQYSLDLYCHHKGPYLKSLLPRWALRTETGRDGASFRSSLEACP